jgi:hypothetical protein
MAQPMICDGPDDTLATFIVTMIDEAETVAMCTACTLDWAQAILQALAPERLAPPPKPPARKRRAAAAATIEDENPVTGAMQESAADATG